MHPPLVTSLSLTAILAGLVPATAPAQNGLDWLRLVGGPTDDIVGFPNRLDVAPNGDVWVAGSTSGIANGDVPVVHLDAAGNQLSSWTFGGSSFDRANAVRLDPGGGAWLYGRRRRRTFRRRRARTKACSGAPRT